VRPKRSRTRSSRRCLLRPKSADSKPRHPPSVRCAASMRRTSSIRTSLMSDSSAVASARPRSCPIGMLLANPADAETNGTVLIHGSWGCFCRKRAATLSPPDDRIPGPCPGAHRPSAKAHTRGGQYQFERACPLGAFSVDCARPHPPSLGGGRMEPWRPRF
jgi:hypothetical protein